MAARRVCLGVITGAHGVGGEVKVRPFTAEPDALDAYGAVENATGDRRLHLTVERVSSKGVIVRIAGVDDRDAALALRGTELWLDRQRLPEPAEDEWYVDDLAGLQVVDTDGAPLGRVRAVADHGGGDVVEILADDGRELAVPFTRAHVPEVDVAAGRLVVAAPEWVEAGEQR
ncbi:MAG: 16S rRNA processing protein RimM [Alphaproteobacteria bacterium]|jgi:16S rRNA processing protein RimM|nr:16S rRNA processing protein RimM [Alphaproteobacteria bacterium]